MTGSQPILIGGRYQIGELLGRGGMAEVRKGTDTRLGRVVAVKRLRTDLASDATFQARFRREAQSSASLNHPSIVAVYDTGEEPAADGSGVQQPYIVMEFVAGRTLRDILREGRKILPERALEITSGVLSALDYSHRAGIIHRDIKPGNVMLTPSGDVKVMDFGIARAISDASSTMTQTAAVVGTAQYLSPEQARGETVDSRSDVYSAGCLLYELLAGRPPFVGDSPVAVAYQHVREQAQPPSDHDTSLPPEIDAIVMKALAKRVEDRYQSAAAMRSDIERYLAGRPVQATPPPPLLPVSQTPPPRPMPVAAPAPTPDATGEEESSSSRGGLVVPLVLLLIGLIVAGVLLWPRLFPTAPEQTQVPDVVRTNIDRARAAIGEAGLTLGDINYVANENVAADRVISQDPSGDSFVDPGSTIDLTVSTGTPEVPVPSVVGLQQRAAVAALEDVDLVARVTETQSDLPAGQVVSTAPEAGQQVESGSTVTLTVSDGPETVPSVEGLTEAEARRQIIAAGFNPVVREEDGETDAETGTVVDQVPEAGEELAQGNDVYIFVTTFEEPTEEPSESPSESPSEDPSGSPSPSPGDTTSPGRGGGRALLPATPSRRTAGRRARRGPAQPSSGSA
ncbi:Stk1 family PASTA domain-containing Ser/Thr kinase [Nocardioides sp. Leaf307]|uniref:Stk1 family PASTA domain-containing Ser/Thr kinase n=1 Tax=Nocardioides sp. Leaf307 TaxID=1736331 RepID=UPI0009EB8834|nr:Stk1 family PASTA domain-containing Ser/Thr kinase [Nocardioides sp. Leaf307]